MSLKKTAPQDSPHAIFTNAVGWTYLVLKTYQTPAKEASSPYARWMVAVSSPMTHGGFDMGDTYIHDILPADLVAATPEWLEAYGLPQGKMTPKQWLFANTDE
jgi:hypothetical protein